MTAPAPHLTSLDAVFGAGCDLHSADSADSADSAAQTRLSCEWPTSEP